MNFFKSDIRKYVLTFFLSFKYNIYKNFVLKYENFEKQKCFLNYFMIWHNMSKFKISISQKPNFEYFLRKQELRNIFFFTKKVAKISL